jgi:hypothetical protein
MTRLAQGHNAIVTREQFTAVSTVHEVVDLGARHYHPLCKVVLTEGAGREGALAVPTPCGGVPTL